MFAVIKTGGKQYRVQKDDVLEIERLEAAEGSTISFGDVLMIGGDSPKIGAPLVSGAAVAAEVVGHPRGPKILVIKKRRRHNYRRKNGHRQLLTRVRITDIQAG